MNDIPETPDAPAPDAAPEGSQSPTPEALQARIMQLAGAVEEDLLGPFLVIAKAAHAGETQVDEAELARAYGTSSPGRIRRLLDHLERQGLVVVREDFGGDRTVMVPGLEPLAEG